MKKKISLEGLREPTREELHNGPSRDHLSGKIQKMKKQDTSCKYCGVSYLVFSEIKSLEKELIGAKQEIQRLELEAKCHFQQENQDSDFVAEIKSLKESLEESKSEVEKLNRAKAVQEKRNKLLESQLSNVTKQIGPLRKQFNEHKFLIKKLSIETKDSLSEYSINLNSISSSICKTLNKNSNQLKLEIKTLQNKLKKCKEEYEEKLKYETCMLKESHNESIISKEEEKSKEIEKLKRKHIEECIVYEDKIEQFRLNKDKMLAKEREHFQHFRKEQETMKSKYDNQTAELTEKFKQESQRALHLQDQIINISAELKVAEKCADSLKSECLLKNCKIQELLAIQLKSDERIEELNNSIALTSQNNKKLNVDIKNSVASLVEIKAKLSKREDEIEEQDRKLKKCEKDIETLRAQLSQKNEDKDETILELRSRYESLQNELSSTRTEMLKLQDLLEHARTESLKQNKLHAEENTEMQICLNETKDQLTKARENINTNSQSLIEKKKIIDVLNNQILVDKENHRLCIEKFEADLKEKAEALLQSKNEYKKLVHEHEAEITNNKNIKALLQEATTRESKLREDIENIKSTQNTNVAAIDGLESMERHLIKLSNLVRTKDNEIKVLQSIVHKECTERTRLMNLLEDLKR